MTIYKQDGSDQIVDDVRLTADTSVFEDEAVINFWGDHDDARFRLGLNKSEIFALIANLSQVGSLL